MSLDSVRLFLGRHAPELQIVEMDCVTATVPAAAAAYGVQPGQIAKTLSLWLRDEVVLLVLCGDTRIDNRKYKLHFDTRPRMVASDDVVHWTSHPIGGVCPFGLPHPLRVFADRALLRFDEVIPAAGDIHAGVRIAPLRLAHLVGAQWVDVAEQPATPPADPEAANA